MQLLIIVAMAANRCIGRDNRMPWHLPADLAHFKRNTMGCPVIMGRKTHESIVSSLGKPLPGRVSVIVSRDLNYRLPAADAGGEPMLLLAGSPSRAIELAQSTGATRAFVIGGAEIFRAMLPAAQHLLVTEIRHSFAGDAFFPSIDPDLWVEHSRAAQAASGTPQVAFDFVEYHRRITT